uniref:Ubiquitin-like protease family profile domain-containing protein n=1 Tax=Auxenochlorella protothecoides TaxID=3075 RepID=A0A1D2ABL5_AUXPR
MATADPAEPPELKTSRVEYDELLRDLRGTLGSQSLTCRHITECIARHQTLLENLRRGTVDVSKMEARIEKLQKFLTLQQTLGEELEREAQVQVLLESTPARTSSALHPATSSQQDPASMRVSSSRKRGADLVRSARQEDGARPSGSSAQPLLPPSSLLSLRHPTASPAAPRACQLCSAVANLRDCRERATQAPATLCGGCLEAHREIFSVSSSLLPRASEGVGRRTAPRLSLTPVPPSKFMGPATALSPRAAPRAKAPRLLSRHSRGVRERGSAPPGGKNSHGTEENPIRLDSSDEEGTPSPRRAPPTQAVDLSSNPEAGVVCETSGIARKLAGLQCVYPREGGPGSVQVTANDLVRLEPGSFLNDTIIDFYLRHVQDRLSSATLSRCYFYSTFFYSKLREKRGGEIPVGTRLKPGATAAECQALRNYHKVQKWTKDVDVFEKDFLFIPVHHALHWSLMIVCHPGCSYLSNAATGPTPCILHLDSMQHGHKSAEAAHRIRSYLEAEYSNRIHSRGEERGDGSRRFDATTFPHKRIKVVKQDNFCDCGLFLCAYAEYFARYLPPYIHAREAYEVAYEYKKTNRDLFEGTPACYPGRLTEHWFRPENAGALRLHIQKLILQLIVEQNDLCLGLGSPHPLWKAVDPRACSAHAALEQIAELEQVEKYMGPEEWLEHAGIQKLLRQEKLDAGTSEAFPGTQEQRRPLPTASERQDVEGRGKGAGSQKAVPASALGRPPVKLPRIETASFFTPKAPASRPARSSSTVSDSSEEAGPSSGGRWRGGSAVTSPVRDVRGLPMGGSPSSAEVQPSPEIMPIGGLSHPPLNPGVKVYARKQRSSADTAQLFPGRGVRVGTAEDAARPSGFAAQVMVDCTEFLRNP